MNFPQAVRSASRSLRSGSYKLRWGLRTVGVGAAITGAANVARVHLSRPSRAEVGLRSGVVLEFDYPSQFPSMLVMFGDLVDPEYAFLRRVCWPGMIVADVGAAIGQFTLFAAGLPDAIVHAFEPSRANVATLRRNVIRNSREDQVVIHKTALSDEDGKAVFETTPHTWTSHLAVSSADRVVMAEEESRAETVAVRAFSGEMRRLGIDRLSIFKVNVAGFEPSVLAGADPFLAEGRADILILLLGLASLPCYARLSAYGYRFFYYHPKEVALYEIISFDASSVLDHRPWPARHIIAIHESAMDRCLRSGLSLRLA